MTRVVDACRSSLPAPDGCELIFRFPRHDAGIEKLETEVALLAQIRPFLTLPIPEPIYQSFTPRTVGQVFAGYRMLPGEPLWHLLATRSSCS